MLSLIDKFKDLFFMRGLIRDLENRGAKVINIFQPVVLNPSDPNDCICVRVMPVAMLLDEAVAGSTVFLHRKSLINFDGTKRVRAVIR